MFDNQKYIAIIPARYASVRFPGKPLVKIRGVSMIQRVYEQALKAVNLSYVAVATDHKKIFDHVAAFGKIIMTSETLPSGTDRCFEAARTLQKQGLEINDHDVILNIQGDEPFIDPMQIDELISCFSNDQVKIATLIKKISQKEHIQNPNVVKVVRDIAGNALYFSRLPIPYKKSDERNDTCNLAVWYKHIGMYAYRYSVLEQITRLSPSALERTESLEQLRWLENGFNIHTKVTDMESFGIDVPEDINRFL